MLSIGIAVLLNGVIGEVDHLVQLVEFELVGRCSDVALAVEVGSEAAVESCEEDVVPDVEFSVLVQ